MSSSGISRGAAGGALLGLSLALSLASPQPAFAALDCSMPEGTIDFATGNLQEVSGSTVGRANLAELYSCSRGVYDGPEVVWELVLAVPGQVAVQLVSSDPGLSAFLVSACDESTCVAWSQPRADCARDLSAGTYWLVVDGQAAAEGDYEVRLVREDEFQRWDACQLPEPPTLPTDTVSDFWRFNDLATCVDDPQSLNFPDGCAFAMYLSVDCGTSLEVVLNDVEGGHLRVHDVFAGLDLTVEARSLFWSQTDTDIQWSDPDCPGVEPGPGGDFAAIRLTEMDGLCGIFRLEFAADHAGFLWEMVANCNASFTPTFDISDSLCAALDGYRPLPLLEFGDVTETYDCPEATITYELVNRGCGSAGEVVVQLLDGAALLATDLIPPLGAGETVVSGFVLPIPDPSIDFHLQVDPNDAVVECGEVPAVACDVGAGDRRHALIGCGGPCQIVAAATATPSSSCTDDPPLEIVIDASASVAGNCPGDALEYVLFDGVGATPPQSSPIFNVSPPAADTPYQLQVTCRADPACDDIVDVPVEVHARPVFAPVSFMATDRSDCDLGVVLEWAPATFLGPGGTGTYNLYRGPTDCSADLALLRVGLTDLDVPFLDDTTVAGATYHYVLEAEDDRTASACDPGPGPGNGGSTARVSADDDGCDPVSDLADCTELDCANGLDDDGDGDADCDDADCACSLGACPAADCDADGADNASDCAPDEGTAFAIPGQAQLRVAAPAVGGVELSWNDQAGAAGTGTTHDVAFATLGTLHSDGAATAPCLVEDLAATTYLDDPAPPAVYYLVRAANACGPLRGEGWGDDSTGLSRPACP